MRGDKAWRDGEGGTAQRLLRACEAEMNEASRRQQKLEREDMKSRLQRLGREGEERRKVKP
jgi:hypothetical protein